ncbi:putative Mrr-cat superfamily restriction endonuclease [Micrococcus sp. TA1]|nr:putative Mrr-cat superfamily restriction endonuclease [Micrococcus sp. TA1]
MTELFHVYDELSPETKRRIPLQPTWALDEDAIS